MADNTINVGQGRAVTMNRVARAWLVAVLSGLLVSACGGGDDEPKAAAEKASKAAAPAKAADATATVKPAKPQAETMATAVADSKTTAAIDLKYNLPAKPAVGQPFAVELAFKPGVQADSLDVEVGDAPGLTIEGERATRFPNVEAGQEYRYVVTVRGVSPGLYYIAVTAKMSTQVQTEGRAFSVPVVIGTPIAAEKTAPPKDATGQPVESMPAKEK
jgi:hypothetical protein